MSWGENREKCPKRFLRDVIIKKVEEHCYREYDILDERLKIQINCSQLKDKTR